MIFENLNTQGKAMVAIQMAKLPIPTKLGKRRAPPGFMAMCVTFEDITQREDCAAIMAKLGACGFVPDYLTNGYTRECTGAFIETLTGENDPRHVEYLEAVAKKAKP